MKDGKENAVLKACLELLAIRGVYAWRNNNLPVYDPAQRRFRKFVGLKGSSDILGVLRWGRFLAVETKAPAVGVIGRKAGRLRADQREFLERVGAMGGVGVCVSDVLMLAEVLDRLELDQWQRFEIDGTPREF